MSIKLPPLLPLFGILAASLFWAGCARLTPDRGEPQPEASPTVDSPFRPESHEHRERFFFNEKSHEIEKSLGL